MTVPVEHGVCPLSVTPSRLPARGSITGDDATDETPPPPGSLLMSPHCPGETVPEEHRFRSEMDGSSKATEAEKGELKSGDGASVEGSSGGCCSCLAPVVRLIPPVYRRELVELLKLALPVVRGATPHRFIIYAHFI